MLNRVLWSTDILIDGQPAFHRLLAPCLLLIMGVGIAQEVPGRTQEGVQCICLARRRPTANRAGRIDEVRLVAQRRLTGRLERDVFRQDHRQLILRYRHCPMRWTIYDGDGRTPISLAADQPVAQAIGNHEFANTLFLYVPGNSGYRFLGRRAVEWARVDHHAQRHFRLRPGIRVARLLARGTNDLTYGNAEFAGELEVALVMRRNAHDRARTIAHQHVIGDPYWNLFATDRISDIAAREDARLLLFRAHTLDLGHVPRLVHVGIDLGLMFGRGDLFDHRMLWR